ncbi:unnamed protein product [Ceratitis capitata]|uniref:(Mediterranean fruit fly) hypothetical protein n=1 Tax=Ceratitis capitata TaxID=7213 RepID=A0A811V4N5_CERCA|nr:unnamed protein product [Ceratitis capitata]
MRVLMFLNHYYFTGNNYEHSDDDNEVFGKNDNKCVLNTLVFMMRVTMTMPIMIMMMMMNVEPK